MEERGVAESLITEEDLAAAEGTMGRAERVLSWGESVDVAGLAMRRNRSITWTSENVLGADDSVPPVCPAVTYVSQSL